MNERIKELKKQAFDEVWDLDNDPIGPGTHFIPDGFEKKFAELMVQDCIRILHSNGYDDAAKCLQDIHFGIENPV